MAFRPLFGAFVITVLLIQISRGRYCQKAVNSVEIVDSCPTSKAKWDAAARKKNCSRIALQQNCTTVEQFQYHCVINGYRNETLEVCAPSRLIFGHCVEFNVPGGVIQDQLSAPCNETFPKCDRIYNSMTAYKYPDCYQLVSITTTTASTPNDGLNKSNDYSAQSVVVVLSFCSLSLTCCSFIMLFYLKKRRRIRFGRKMALIFGSSHQSNESRRRESRRLLQTFEEQNDNDDKEAASDSRIDNPDVLQPNYDGVLYTDQTQDAHGTQPEELSTVKSDSGPREDSPETHSLNHNVLQPETDEDASDARSDDHDVLQQNFDQRKDASDNQSEELSTVQSDSDNMCDTELPTRNISPAPSSIQSASSGSTIYEDASDAKSDDRNVLEPNSDQRKDASDNPSEKLSTVQLDSDDTQEEHQLENGSHVMKEVSQEQLFPGTSAKRVRAKFAVTSGGEPNAHSRKPETSDALASPETA